MAITRREAMLAMMGGAASVLLTQRLFGEEPPTGGAAKPPADLVAAMAATPITTQAISDSVKVLMGPGGNVTVIVNGGQKIVVDSG